MHCEDPGCLRACPADGAIVQYTNGIVDFQQENCIGCQYCVTGLPVRHPEVQSADQEGLQVHAVLGPRRAGARAGVHQGVSDRLPAVRHEGRHARAGREARASSCASIRDFAERRRLRSAVDRRHARHLRAARRRRSRSCTAGLPANPQIPASLHDVEARSRSRSACCWRCLPRRSRSSTTSPKDRRSRSRRHGATSDDGGRTLRRRGTSPRQRAWADDRSRGRAAAASGLHARAALDALRSSSSSRCSRALRSTRRGSFAALTPLFGGGPMTRLLHPWFSLGFVVFFALQVLNWLAPMTWTPDDSPLDAGG